MHPLPISVHLLLVDSPGYYVVLVQRIVTTTSELIVLWSDHKWIGKDKMFLMEIAQHEDNAESNCKGLL